MLKQVVHSSYRSIYTDSEKNHRTLRLIGWSLNTPPPSANHSKTENDGSQMKQYKNNKTYLLKLCCILVI
jgi:hypothetical protein